MKHKQSKLSEPMVTTSYSKNHKLREPKKKWLTYHEPKTLDTKGILEKIDELYPNNNKIVALSGGKDSGVVLDKNLDIIQRAFFIKTNVGVQDTEDFVQDQCQKYGIPLDIREPAPHAFVYVAICLEAGFPSAGMHDMIMSFLKYKTMIKYVSDPQHSKKPILLSGVRKYESTRRKFNYNQPINIDSDRIVFACPIFYETDEDVYRYYIENGLKRSPVYDWAGTSFECACGSFGTPLEYQQIKQHAPKLYNFLEWIREGILQFGKPKARKYANWGNSRPIEDEQEVMEKYLGKDYQHAVDVSQMICGAECGAGTMRSLAI